MTGDTPQTTRLPKDERGRFFSPKCVEDNCDGQLVPDPQWGEDRWRCDGLREFIEGGSLDACDYMHTDGDVADWRAWEKTRRRAA